MDPMKCPQCGAPAQIAPGQMMYQCPFCKQSFQTGQQPSPPPPQAFPQKQQQIPQIVIIAPGGHRPQYDSDGDHVANAVSSGMNWIFRLLIPLIVLIAILGSSGAWWFTRNSGFGSSLVWDGKTPFECGGNDDYSVKDVKAEFTAGTAIIANGNCHFTCTNCTIKAPTAIEAGGNAQVTIINGSVEGTETMVEAGGNARVNISGNATASGAVKSGGNAKVSAPKPAATPTASTATPADAVSASPTPTNTAAPTPKPKTTAATTATATTKPTATASATAKPTASAKK